MAIKLDWTLETREERVSFIHDYINSYPYALTAKEKEQIADYMLWGKNKDGLNGRQEGLDLESKHTTWNSKNFESLEALLESPNFSETILRKPSDPIYKIPRPNFSRSEARENAPQYILDSLEELWHRIDSTELLISYYELAHNLRKLPIRDELLRRFTDAEKTEIDTRAQKLSNYQYLKKKHELVELRREQYTYKDNYAEPIMSAPTFNFFEVDAPSLLELFEFAPMGLPSETLLGKRLFRADRYPTPDDFSEVELAEISKLLWRAPRTSNVIDFTNPSHLYSLIENIDTILNSSGTLDPIFEDLKALFLTYASLARLKPHYQRILDLKLQHKKNQEIAQIVNSEFNKNYTLNYISTIYCKTIMKEIAAAAAHHRQVCENLFFPENFKKCLGCGRLLLRDEYNFMHRCKVSDGFAPRCKACERIRREKQKEKTQNEK